MCVLLRKVCGDTNGRAHGLSAVIRMYDITKQGISFNTLHSFAKLILDFFFVFEQLYFFGEESNFTCIFIHMTF